MTPRRMGHRVSHKNTRRLAALAGLVGLGLPMAPAAMAQPVVQSLPGGASQSLNAALARLGRDPRDLAALIEAGNAALQMGDVDAATGFFARADQLSPNNMRVKAGLAAALVRSENPFDAIPLFAEAEAAGAMDPMLNSDRGLAYDLVGDNQTAQRYYRQSLAGVGNDETVRRFALSQAISGDRAGMELTLSPLLQKQDKGAWRTRAFALAILGRPDEAVAIANQTMPVELANGIAPYLRYMPRLTPAQQAAAANFGRFPRAAEIGRDDPRVALYAPPKRAATADASLVPAGEPLGTRNRSRRDTRVAAATPPPAPQPTRSAPPEPMPTRQIESAPALAMAPVPERRSAAPAPAPAPAFAAVAAPPVQHTAASPAPMPTIAASAAPSPATPATAPSMASASGFNLARVSSPASPSVAPAAAAAPVSTRAPAPVPAPAAPASPAAVPATTFAAAPAPAPVARPVPVAAPRPRRVADAFADLALPSASTSPAPGAVDVRRIAAAKPKPVEPPKPLHPSRIWVQVGTGRDVRALGFTWRELTKDNTELFRGKSAWVSDWGRTNRLLTGPFASEAAAEAFLARLKKKDLDAFLWTSPAGQVVDDLPGR